MIWVSQRLATSHLNEALLGCVVHSICPAKHGSKLKTPAWHVNRNEIAVVATAEDDGVKTALGADDRYPMELIGGKEVNGATDRIA